MVKVNIEGKENKIIEQLKWELNLVKKQTQI
jgi:hypothetical protein